MKLRGRGAVSCLFCNDSVEFSIFSCYRTRFGVKLLYETDKFNIMMQSTRMCIECIGRFQQLIDFHHLKSRNDEDRGFVPGLCDFCNQTDLMPEEHLVKARKVLMNTKWEKDYKGTQELSCCYVCYNFLAYYKKVEMILKQECSRFYHNIADWFVVLVKVEKEKNPVIQIIDIETNEDEVQSGAENINNSEQVAVNSTPPMNEPEPEKSNKGTKRLSESQNEEEEVTQFRKRRNTGYLLKQLQIEDNNTYLTCNTEDKFTQIKRRRSDCLIRSETPIMFGPRQRKRKSLAVDMVENSNKDEAASVPASIELTEKSQEGGTDVVQIQEETVALEPELFQSTQQVANHLEQLQSSEATKNLQEQQKLLNTAENEIETVQPSLEQIEPNQFLVSDLSQLPEQVQKSPEYQLHTEPKQSHIPEAAIHSSRSLSGADKYSEISSERTQEFFSELESHNSTEQLKSIEKSQENLDKNLPIDNSAPKVLDLINCQTKPVKKSVNITSNVSAEIAEEEKALELSPIPVNCPPKITSDQAVEPLPTPPELKKKTRHKKSKNWLKLFPNKNLTKTKKSNQQQQIKFLNPAVMIDRLDLSSLKQWKTKKNDSPKMPLQNSTILTNSEKRGRKKIEIPLSGDLSVQEPLSGDLSVQEPLPKDLSVQEPLPKDLSVQEPLPKDSTVQKAVPKDLSVKPPRKKKRRSKAKLKKKKTGKGKNSCTVAPENLSVQHASVTDNSAILPKVAISVGNETADIEVEVKEVSNNKDPETSHAADISKTPDLQLSNVPVPRIVHIPKKSFKLNASLKAMLKLASPAAIADESMKISLPLSRLSDINSITIDPMEPDINFVAKESVMDMFPALQDLDTASTVQIKSYEQWATLHNLHPLSVQLDRVEESELESILGVRMPQFPKSTRCGRISKPTKLLEFSPEKRKNFSTKKAKSKEITNFKQNKTTIAESAGGVSYDQHRQGVAEQLKKLRGIIPRKGKVAKLKEFMKQSRNSCKRKPSFSNLLTLQIPDEFPEFCELEETYVDYSNSDEEIVVSPDLPELNGIVEEYLDDSSDVTSSQQNVHSQSSVEMEFLSKEFAHKGKVVFTINEPPMLSVSAGR